MIKKLSMIAGVLALAAMVLGAFAPAASAEEESRDTFLRGRGVLDARGDGLVAVKGRIDLTASADAGILLVKDIAGDADIDVRGHGSTVDWRGFRVYFGFLGEAHVTGSNVAVIVVGNDINLHAAGKGWAYLKGDGSYMVNGHGPFPWSPDGGFAAVEPESDEPAAAD